MTEAAGVLELWSGRFTSYADIDRQSRQLVRALRRRLEAPPVVAMVLDNCAEYYVTLRTLAGGVSLVPINAQLADAEIRYIAEDAGANAVIVTAGHADVADRLRDLVEVSLVIGGAAGDTDFAAALASEDDGELDPGPPGTVFRYTSGTTGRPKAIVPRDVPTGEGASRDFGGATAMLLGMDESTRLLLTAPLFHAGPMLLSVAAQSVGGSLVLADRFDAAEALATIERERITHSYWVPTMFNRMLRLDDEVRHAHDLSSHRAAVHVGAPCPRPVKERMLEWWGPIIHELYGGSEGIGMTYASPGDWLAHPGTVGRPIGCAVHICDEAGNELPAGETGVVYFDTGSVPFEYKDAPEKMVEAIHPSQPTWCTLGDVGYVDDDGFVYLTDRRSDIIITGGVNVYSREVESALAAHHAVADVVVIGVPDPEYGERVAALVEVADGAGDQALADELDAFVLTTLARFKRPRLIAFTASVPRQPTGKVRKVDVVAALEEATAAGRVLEPARDSERVDGGGA